MRMDVEIKNFLRCTAAKVTRTKECPVSADELMQEWEGAISDNDFLLLLGVASSNSMRIPAVLLKGIKLAFCTACEDALDNLVSDNFTKRDVYDVIKYYLDIVKKLYDSKCINAQTYCDILDIYSQNIDYIKNYR